VLLVDEKALSDLAEMCGLKTWNAWTVLLESLNTNSIQFSDIESAMAELGKKRRKLTNTQAAEMKAAKAIASK
jgi:hypothetical protein